MCILCVAIQQVCVRVMSTIQVGASIAMISYATAVQSMLSYPCCVYM